MTGVCTQNWDIAEELPGDTEAGTKLAVTPAGSPVTASDTVPGTAPFTAVTVIGKTAVAPRTTVCAGDGEETVKLTGGVPVPVSAVVCGEPAALSETDNVAAKWRM